MAIWVGYETSSTPNNAIIDLLTELSPGGDPTLQGVIPVFYGYFIPFKADIEGINRNCDTHAKSPNICIDGADWIRKNRDFLRQTYSEYAKNVAAIWGTERPLIWFFEPGFNDYIRTSQTAPLTMAELSNVASDLVNSIKAHLPNAKVSHFASPQLPSFKDYFGALDLSLIDFINVSGSAQYTNFFSGNSGEYPQSTYLRLHEETGLPILVDTGFGASKIVNSGWLTEPLDVMNARIADGVVGVVMDEDTEGMQDRIDTITSGLSPLVCVP
jgi:hypothetical protein